jgi:hypothetical protein
MRDMRSISPTLAMESFEQVMGVITLDGSVKPESVKVLIDWVREKRQSDAIGAGESGGRL